MTLTDDQKRALKKIAYELQQPGKHFITLTGYAGTGKTTLAKKIIERMKDVVGNKIEITLLAPTHKAARVLEEKTGVKATTVHSKLAMRPKWDGNGGYKFVSERDIDLDHRKKHLFVIDEASMQQFQLHDILQKLVRSSRLSIDVLYIGDDAQLPPVNQNQSPAFDHTTYKLTDIVRQAGTNPIIDLAHKFRSPQDNFIDLVEDDVNDDGDGVLTYVDRSRFIEKALEYFDTKTYEDDSDFVSILSYRNKYVDTYNKVIRDKIIGKGKPDFVAGEWIISKEPFFTQDKYGANRPVINNRETALIKGVEEQKSDDGELEYWLLNIEPRGFKRDEFLPVLKREYVPKYEKMLKRLKSIARDRNQEQGWKPYYQFKESYADVSYTYAMTVHTSQGSTFDHTFVDMNDVQVCRDVTERTRLAYVAITRAAKTLHLLF